MLSGNNPAELGGGDRFQAADHVPAGVGYAVGTLERQIAWAYHKLESAANREKAQELANFVEIRIYELVWATFQEMGRLRDIVQGGKALPGVNCTDAGEYVNRRGQAFRYSPYERLVVVDPLEQVCAAAFWLLQHDGVSDTLAQHLAGILENAIAGSAWAIVEERVRLHAEYINQRADIARRAQIASWQLKQELRGIDERYKAEIRNELQKELRAIDDKWQPEIELEKQQIELEKQLVETAQALDGAVTARQAQEANARRASGTQEDGAQQSSSDTVGVVSASGLTSPTVGVDTTAANVVAALTQALSLLSEEQKAAVLSVLSPSQGQADTNLQSDQASSKVTARHGAAAMGDPSTSMTGVSTTPAQQAQGATR